MERIVWSDTAAEPAVETEVYKGECQTSVAVIGGGYAGLSAALHLAESGTDCLLLEAQAFGAGASGRNNGQVIPGLKYGPDDLETRYGDAGAVVAQTAAGTADLVFDLIAKHAIDCEPDRRGWVRAAHSPVAMPTIEKQAAQWERRGAPVELLDRNQTESLLGTSNYIGGMIDRRAGRLQPLSYCRGLARAAKAAGAKLHQHSPVRAMTREGGRWRLDTDGGTVRADKVILATGAYHENLIPGWSTTFMTVQAMQIASEPLTANIARSILPGVSAMSDTRKLANAIRMDAAGRLAITGRGPLSGKIDNRIRGDLIRAITRLFPAVEGQVWSHIWAGRIGITIDELPRLAAPRPACLAIVGFNGRGVAMATALGKAAADHTIGREAGFPVVDAPTIPFHSLRRPALATAISYYRMRDALGFAGR